jgi:hypothetical protein
MVDIATFKLVDRSVPGIVGGMSSTSVPGR